VNFNAEARSSGENAEKNFEFLSLFYLLRGDEDLEPRRFATDGWHTESWDLPAAPAGPVRVAFRSSPPYQPIDDVGLRSIAVGAFGFVGW
jgi:hypothetical protein